MAAGSSCTIVEYFGGDDGYRCGYCKNEKGNFSHGMWSHAMTVQDYQDLIDRGWRRSGKYVYKPIMNKTCCPQYTIRCHALNFQPSKTHKKILKKMSKFLSKGEMPTEQDTTPGEFETARKDPVSVPDGRGPETTPKPGKSKGRKSRGLDRSELIVIYSLSPSHPLFLFPFFSRSPSLSSPSGVGADPGRPLCRKAKELRKARRLQKDQKRQVGGGVPVSATSIPTTPVQLNQPKALEEFINESLPDSPLHRLEVRLVRSNPPSSQFKASFDASYQVYKLYQMAIHHDPPDKPTESQFRRFLCDSPLEMETPPDGPAAGYGSFHQQYWLDGRIVAVGVVDILPTCVSSVYLYYHPDFASLSLGSYSALREVAFTRQLQKQSPKLCFYYLGFYIHSCNKMRYKGQYQPSDLLCPETYVFVPIECCIPSLEQNHYARFNQDPDAGDTHVLKDLGRALVLYRRTVMPYAAYARKRKCSNDEMEVAQYAGLVGQVCAERILLYRA
uniref:Arginyl-tRNA--protein transferase 1 n=1 Tax=Oncorhynchus tshawytscha TaxID=74940 RepID=A0AAZ3SBN8_ONCTS